MNIDDIEQEFLRLRPNLSTLLTLSTKNEELTEDILQDSIIEILKKYQNGFEINEDTFKKYLYTIAYTRMIDQLRKPYRKMEISTEDLPLDWEKGTNDRNDHSFTIYGILQSLLADNRLDQRMRDILRMRLVNKMKVEDICKYYNISRQTVFRDYQKGIKLLKNEFLKQNLSPDHLDS
ncbi:RNA polymerase sigma factor [Leptospira sp. GIMC2001]|uniref:RNA polymerase sigma factor n=1 Tax=Leptospira sp. GIMC2001 TaxID=1513297 RepID=UPI002349E1C1|nr:sigma-70 family RNA polymerase sigma factor [Leptospira sp. GIMC2001]WCL50118.1 sigma-70 family RNA polymerase sigma factor [Leptospira sp. GIMC2001]